MKTQRATRVHNPGRCVLVSLLVLASLVPVSAQSEPARDTDLAHIFVDQVLRARAAGMPLPRPRAEHLLSRALEFDAASSDAYFLLADTRIDEQSNTRANIAYLSAALKHDTWRAIERYDGVIALATLYNRIGAYREAIETLSLVGATDRMRSEYLFGMAGALYGANDRTGGDEFAARGRRLFPSDPRFFVVYEFADPIPTLRTERWLDLYESRSAEFLEAVLAYATLTDGDVRRRALERYRRLGGRSARAEILGLPYAESLSQAWESVLESGGGELLDVVVEFHRFARERADTAALSEVRRFARTLDGDVFVKPSNDAFYTIRYSFSDGRVTRIVFDENTDGVEDLVVAFDEGRIVSAVIRVGDRAATGNHTTIVEYAQYPVASTVRFEHDDRYRVYTTIDGRVRIPVFPSGSDAGSPTDTTFDDDIDALRLFPIERLRTIVDERSLDARARIREEFDGSVTRFVSIENGVPFRSVEDSNGDGVIDRIVFFRDGVPYGARRDLLGDGTFDAYELIVANEVTVIAVDTRGDSVWDFLTTVGDDVHRVWDFDGDGLIDAEERSGVDGPVRAYAADIGGTGVSVRDVRYFFEGAE